LEVLKNHFTLFCKDYDVDSDIEESLRGPSPTGTQEDDGYAEVSEEIAAEVSQVVMCLNRKE